MDSERFFALVGNPNIGKTTLFNALTGLRQKVANYPGVTVEKKEGTARDRHGNQYKVLDLPGAYSLEAKSPDEEVTRAVLRGERADTPQPDVVVCLVDASNLERHFYLATQVMELGLPTIVVLNKTDEAKELGITVAAKKLEERLGVPVVPMQANERVGMEALQVALSSKELAKPQWRPVEGNAAARYEAIDQLLSGTVARSEEERLTPADKWDQVLVHPVWGWVVLLSILAGLFYAIFSLSGYPMDWIDAGFAWLGECVGNRMQEGDFRSLITEGIIGGVGGVVIFLPQILMLFFFISLMENTGYLARVSFMMDRLMSGVGLNGNAFIPVLSSYACAIPGIMATRTMESPRARLITILVAPITSCSARLPVYLMLIALMLPLGTATQKAFVMWGLYILSILGVYFFAWIFNRTLKKTETTLTILELPTYQRPSWREIGLQILDRGKIFVRRAGTVILALSILLWAMVTYPKNHEYEKRVAAAESILETQIELSENLTPQIEVLISIEKEVAEQNVKLVLRSILEEKQTQLSVANRIIESKSEEIRDLTTKKLAHSAAGRLGKAIEPGIEPLGYDWKMGVGLVASFAAREVFVSTMSIIYLGEDKTEEGGTVSKKMAAEKRADGQPAYNLRTCLSLLVFYVFAMQCLSTVAVTRRETNSWRWAIFQVVYLTGFAYLAAFATYQISGFFIA
ncbi:50S ribosome-binding GTPase [Verrucomicrobia bacterium]|nr:50S ribosome-binding GTPase [Verrucomicrobiota bacterium]